MRIQIFRLLAVLCLQLPLTFALETATTKAADPDPLVTAESDYVLKDFHFVDGESFEMRCSNPVNRSTRLSTTSSYPMRLDLAVQVSPVMDCMIDFPAMATKIWSQPRNDWSPRVSE